MHRRRRHTITADRQWFGSSLRMPALICVILMLFFVNTIHAQVLTNSGAVISVTENTYVQGDTIDNETGEITNDGILNLNGNFNNAATTSGDGLFNIAGNWNNTGSYSPGNSTVRLNGAGLQRVINSGTGNFRRLIIEKTGTYPSSRIRLQTNVEVTSSLEMENGIIETDDNKLFLSSFSAASLDHTSGYVIGKFERGINSADNYLFPLGSSAHYNPLNLDPNLTPSNGSVLSEFIPDALDTLGMPFPDEDVEVYNILRDGYWSLTANNGFNVGDFNINMDGTGFTDPNPVQEITRIVRRPAGGNWTIDGDHRDGTPPVANRDNLTGNISSSGTIFAFANVRPLIIQEPQDTAVCDGTEATFTVVATGIPPITYQWQERVGAMWYDLPEGGNYTGTRSSSLTINSADLTMDGNQYRVRIMHRSGHLVRSRWASLTVNPNPRAIPTPRQDTLCYGDSTFIELTSDVAGTTFEWEVIYSGVIQGTANGSTATDGDTINQTLTNPTDFADSVVYRIIPTGPEPTNCYKHDTTVIVWVNPIPRVEISVVEDTLCDEGTSTITVTSPTILTSGEVKYDFTIEDLSNSSGEVTGQDESLFESLGSVEQTLDNTTDHYQWVEYRIHPYSFGQGRGVNCDFGDIRDTIFRIYVNPTPRVFVEVVEDTICDGETSTITVSSPTVLTDGEVKYDHTIIGTSGGVTGQTDYLNESLGSTTQTLANNTDQFQYVEFRVHPYTEGPGPGTNCDYGDVRDSTYRIIVNPTPNIFVTISNDLITSDTIFCNGFTVDFSLENFQLATGEIKYDLEVTGDVGIISGETPTTDSLEITGFSNALSHANDSIRYLDYRFMPYIENAQGSHSCYSGIDTVVTVKVVPVLTANEIPTVLYGGYNITCNGLSDGEIVMDPVGGDYRYTYDIRWQDEGGEELQAAQDTADLLENLSAGIYGYEITDTLGCFFTDTFRITEPDTLAIESFVIESPECYGDDPTGRIYVELTGGVEINDYAWNSIYGPVGSLEDLEGVRAGRYDYTFIDYHECQFDTTFRILPADRLNATIFDISEFGDYEISCNGNTNGWIEVIGQNSATDVYDYRWYAADRETVLADTNLLRDVGAGTYYFWLVDGKGCLLGEGVGGDSLMKFELTEPDPVSFRRETDDLYAGDWDISCFGADNGRINLEYSGGHSDYMENRYTWTKDGVSFSTDSILDALEPGAYQVTLTNTIIALPNPDATLFDTLYCSGDTTLTLFEPPEITYDTVMSGFFGPHHISCFGRTDGFVALNNVQGGGTKTEQGIYTYAWTPPEGFTLDDPQDQDQDNLGAGKYYFTITDQIGCSVIDSAELTQPDSLYAVPDTAMRNGYAISCYNGSDGELSITPHGGNRPYTYDWSSVGTTTDTALSNLPSGYYAVTITDPNGCSNFYEWQLEHPDTIVLNPDPERLIECFGDTSTLEINPTGGVGGFTYLWNGTETTKDLHGAAEGTHVVVVTDANGCVVDDSIYLGQRPEIIPEIFITSDYNGKYISCYDSADAVIQFVISGGNDAGYTFEWNTSEADDNKYILSGLPAGVYRVEGEDASGCFFSAEREVIEPTDIDVVITSEDPLCAGINDGRILLSVVGGTPFDRSPSYNYSLNGEDNLPEPEFEQLAEGMYTVAVTDANDCTDTSLVEITSPDFLLLEYETTPAECPDESDGALDITYIDGGTMPYFINGSPERYFDNLSPGAFPILLTDGNGCLLRDTAIIESFYESCLFIPDAFSPNGDGANDRWILDEDPDGTNDMYLYPDAQLRIYDRWGEMVYYSNNVADEPWDGTYRGRDLPVDTYHYVLDLGNGDPPITGSVTLVRDKQD